MGFFSKKSKKTSYTTNNYDQSVNAADSELTLLGDGAVDKSVSAPNSELTLLGDEAIMAEEVGIKTDSDNLNIAGANNTVSQFGKEAANVVNNAIASMESITTKNLQLRTEKDLLSDRTPHNSFFPTNNAPSSFNRDLKHFFNNPKVQIGLVLIGGGAIYLLKGKK